jgi:hypothetical protein
MAAYEIRKHDRPNEWAVVDTVTGEIARKDGLLLAGPSFDQASANRGPAEKKWRQPQG